jgi:hypothetical protein
MHDIGWRRSTPGVENGFLADPIGPASDRRRHGDREHADR